MKAGFITVFVISCISIGCKKEEKVPIFHPGDMTYGRMDAKKNGKNWIASSSAQNYDNIHSLFALDAVTYSEEGFLREELFLNKIPKKVGKYVVSGPYNDIIDDFIGSAYHTLEDDGDVLEDTWDVDETAADNYLEITFIDTIENIVKGNMTVSFKISTDGGKRNADNPDKVKFSKGAFDVTFFN
ncbi:MAG: hypothetical protein GC192_16835 [Bacteroidetes bacterium]|nr:hypothetical protein [Bacteroidota bacterium]